MAILKAFKGIRPVADLAKNVASRPYDVLNKQEAREIAKDNPHSFLHVVKPEIDASDDINEYDSVIYKSGKDYFDKMVADGVFKQDDKDKLYIYAQSMNGRTQYGIVGCSAVEDYFKNVIKKHELTRDEKQTDRICHIRVSRLHYEPVFFAYRANKKIDAIVADVVKEAPIYDFTTDLGIGHHFWVIEEEEKINQITDIFEKEIPETYIADGHHRTAAAALVGKEKEVRNENHTGNEQYNFFLTVLFPDDQLAVFEYNRVIKDINGLTKDELLNELASKFEVNAKGSDAFKPGKLHTFSMYIEGEWYELVAKQKICYEGEPLKSLDVSILHNEIMGPILNLYNLQQSKRIDYVGGIRGLEELKRRVDSGEMKVAFAMYPVSMEQILTIADTNNIMPPKTTWFEPKLRSGLIIHDME